MRIDPADDSHPQPTATPDHLTKAVVGSQIGAAVMKRDIRWIERNGPASAQTGALGANFLEVAQPESRIVVAGIIFGERNLEPATRADRPAAVRRPRHPGFRGCEAPDGSRCRGHGTQSNEIAAGIIRHVVAVWGSG